MTGPVERLIGKPEVADDGRLIHSFRQSTLNTLNDCLEKGRRVMTATLPRWETDAACIGTALHLGAETALKAQIETGIPAPYEEALAAAHGYWEKVIQKENFSLVQMATEKGARAHIDRCLRVFYDQVLETLEPRAVEVPFGKTVDRTTGEITQPPLTIYEDEQRILQITGTIDYLDVFGPKDWKTASRWYEPWEYERWAVQPTVYTMACDLLGLVERLPDGTIPFEYVVFKKGAEAQVQRLTVYRHQGDWNWLIDKCLGIAELVEHEVAVWPKNDAHALCSPKWCPAWDTCKGLHYSQWPRPSRPSRPRLDGKIVG